MFCWLVGYGTPFGKTLSPAFRRIFKQISGYPGLSRHTFNTMLGEDYTAFTICVGTKLLEYEDCYLGMRFFNFHHEMFNGTGGNNYLGASCSFIHDLYLHIVKLKLKFNKKTYGSEYIAEILEDILKTDYNFDFSNNERTVISDRINAATKVT